MAATALCGTAIHFPSIIYPSRSISLSSLLLPRPSSTNTTRLKAIGPSAEMLSATRISIQPPFHPTYDIKGIIKLALAEDSGDRGDVTCLATISHEVQAEASFLAKETGVIAGIAMADMIFEEVDPLLKTEWKVKDGDIVEKGTVFGTIFGSARSLLLAERVVLNFMQRMSGIATATKAMAEAARPARILETRKTAPGLRLLDKWAVLIGGGQNHRMGLYDMVLVKDNHIAVAGGIKGAVGAVNKYLMENKLEMGVEVETRTIDEVKEVLAFINEEGGQVSRIMLDNMVAIRPDGEVDVAMLQEAVQLINGQVETEASGNVTINTVRKIGATGVTYISSGSLTHSVKALDISLNIDTELALAVGRRSNRA